MLNPTVFFSGIAHLGETAVNHACCSKFKFKSLLLFRSLYAWECLTHHLTTIGGIALARAIGSKICSFHFVCLLKAHMNLNGIQRLYGLMG